ncbi:MAG: DUF3472 domain-containing protein [Chitinophagaceae bacterium]|nr:DUF3472 domain-containing protein [Chitinophagaceae bacterium]
MNIRIAFLLVVLSSLSLFSVAQAKLEIPAYTAYARPAEAYSEDEAGSMFTKEAGIRNWTDASRQISFFFKIRKTGKLQLSLLLKNDQPGSKLTAVIAGKKFMLDVPFSKKFKAISVGTLQITDTGFYELQLSAPLHKKGPIADIKSLLLSGDALANIHFNPDPRKNSASVHLFYPLDDSLKIVSFYNEITIPQDADHLHSYYMACGFARGYFGIQVNSETERRVIFSVWDAGDEANDRNKVSEENKVQLMAKGDQVFADGFGNEGTGGHSHWIYPWKTGITYRFLVTAAVDSAKATTSYAGYFYVPETQKWKLIACFKAPKDGKPLRKLYSFVENFDGSNGQEYRKALFSSPWIRKDNGDWKELETARFSYDATGKAGHRIDYGGGTENNRFYLWNGGFRQNNCSYGALFTRTPENQKPVVDLYKNADSATEYALENKLIREWISRSKPDTAGLITGVYYQILKEGTGDLANLNDTVIVRYKGSLLNGDVFDQTDQKTATFPLKRLIKGWQIGVPMCREGGIIRLIIPSYLGYSIRNLGVIPPNSPLVFDITLEGLKKGKS